MTAAHRNDDAALPDIRSQRLAVDRGEANPGAALSSPSMTRSSALILAVVLATGAACGGDDEPESADAGYNCALDDRGETYSAGMTKTGDAGYQFAIVDALPSPPAKSDNDITISITDADGNPAATAGLNILPCMPDHGHGSAIKPTVTPNGDGTFTIERLNLWMPGLWELSIWATDAGADVDRTCTKAALVQPVDQVTFRFCIDG